MGHYLRHLLSNVASVRAGAGEDWLDSNVKQSVAVNNGTWDVRCRYVLQVVSLKQRSQGLEWHGRLACQ